MPDCRLCGSPVHPDRVAYGWDLCVSCVAADWRLIDRAPYRIGGQHKSGDVIVRADQELPTYD